MAGADYAVAESKIERTAEALRNARAVLTKQAQELVRDGISDKRSHYEAAIAEGKSVGMSVAAISRAAGTTNRAAIYDILRRWETETEGMTIRQRYEGWFTPVEGKPAVRFVAMQEEVLGRRVMPANTEVELWLWHDGKNWAVKTEKFIENPNKKIDSYTMEGLFSVVGEGGVTRYYRGLQEWADDHYPEGDRATWGEVSAILKARVDEIKANRGEL